MGCVVASSERSLPAADRDLGCIYRKRSFSSATKSFHNAFSNREGRCWISRKPAHNSSINTQMVIANPQHPLWFSGQIFNKGFCTRSRSTQCSIPRGITWNSWTHNQIFRLFAAHARSLPAAGKLRSLLAGAQRHAQDSNRNGKVQGFPGHAYNSFINAQIVTVNPQHPFGSKIKSPTLGNPVTHGFKHLTDFPGIFIQRNRDGSIRNKDQWLFDHTQKCFYPWLRPGKERSPRHCGIAQKQCSDHGEIVCTILNHFRFPIQLNGIDLPYN